jgi:DNA-binding XRE family transcriptional regulator
MIMGKQKEPPGYPGDEAVSKAFIENVRRIRIAKGLSVEQGDALVAAAVRMDTLSNPPRAIGLVVRELRETRQMSHSALSRASGVSVRFVVQVEHGKADPSPHRCRSPVDRPSMLHGRVSRTYLHHQARLGAN